MRIADVGKKKADAIKADVMRNGWKEEIQSFSQAYGNLDLDSSLLLMEPYGFIDADDIRYHKTVKAVKQSLLHKGLMYAIILMMILAVLLRPLPSVHFG